MINLQFVIQLFSALSTIFLLISFLSLYRIIKVKLKLRKSKLNFQDENEQKDFKIKAKKMYIKFIIWWASSFVLFLIFLGLTVGLTYA